LHLRGEHQMQLGYTFLWITDEAKGLALATPNNWLTFNAAFSVMPGRVQLVSTLFLSGASEDPNRLPRLNSSTCPQGMFTTPASCGGEALSSNLVLDRVPAAAIWNLGAHVKRVFLPALEIDAFVYNVLDQRWYQQD